MRARRLLVNRAEDLQRSARQTCHFHDVIMARPIQADSVHICHGGTAAAVPTQQLACGRGPAGQAQSPVNQSFQGPALMSRVDTSCALMKSFGFVYTSIALWLCAA